MKVQKDLEIIKFSESFINYLKSNSRYESFTKILKSFLENYLISNDYKPIDCIITMFKFLNEEYSEPMVKIIYSSDEKFDNLRIREDNIEKNFKVNSLFFLFPFSQVDKSDLKRFKVCYIWQKN